MKTELHYTLLTDGSSDIALLPILDWLLIQNGIEQPIQSQWADLRSQREPPRELLERIRRSLDLYPCDLLFIRRDAERLTLEQRASEIRTAIAKAGSSAIPPNVFVIPVRMTEAWLLFDERAIRFAAGNQNGHIPLDLPNLNALEDLSDPKSTLHELILKASGLYGRRLKRLNPNDRVRRVPISISDFAPLRTLAAFQSLEKEIKTFVTDQWQQ